MVMVSAIPALVSGVSLGLMFVHKAVLMALSHGLGLEVQSEVTHAELFCEKVLDTVLMALGVLQALGLHDDVGCADRQVAADAP